MDSEHMVFKLAESYPTLFLKHFSCFITAQDIIFFSGIKVYQRMNHRIEYNGMMVSNQWHSL